MTGTLSVGGTHADTTKELYVNGDIEATATAWRYATTLSSTLDVSGNTEITGTLSVGGTHADTTKELYVNGDIEATATLVVGTDVSVHRAERDAERRGDYASTLDVSGNTEITGKLAVGGPVSGGTTKKLYVTGDIESTATLVVGTDARRQHRAERDAERRGDYADEHSGLTGNTEMRLFPLAECTLIPPRSCT